MGKIIAYRSLLSIVSCALAVSGVFAQPDINDQLDAQVPEIHTYSEDIVDSVYGVTIYESLNLQLGGDSVRHCDGYACQSWVEDYYESGQLMHRGYYIDGQLKIYKNYYPNGQLERDFKNVDNVKSKVTLYYDNGETKSEITYFNGQALEWTDYWPNGNIEYYENYHKSFDYHLEMSSYYESGSLESQFILDNKKKLIFTKTEYYPDGTLKMEGEFQYDKDAWHLFKEGKWTYYDESGKSTKTEQYDKGELVSK